MAETIWRKTRMHDRIEEAGRLLLSWYVAQARAFLSDATRAWLLDRGEREVIVRPRGENVSIEVVGRSTVQGTIGGQSGRSLSAADLQSITAQRSRPAKVILELPREDFLVQRFKIPATARGSLPEILPREIERKTCFKPDEIFSGATLRSSAGEADKLDVTHWILRRDMAQAALESMGLSLDNVDMARPEPGSDGPHELPMIAIGQETRESRRPRLVLISMAAVALVLLVASGVVRDWRDAQGGERIDNNIAAASQRAKTVRDMANRAIAKSALLASLRSERAKLPALSDLLEETARVLPDSAYVYEWKLSESAPGAFVIDLGGLAQAPTDLPSLFDKSPLFSETALTAAITPDQQSKRERFALETRVRTRAGTSHE